MMAAEICRRYVALYVALISSPTQLAQLREAATPAQLLGRLKVLWQCEQLTDDALLSLLHQLNQQPLSGAGLQLAGLWLPWQYLPATAAQSDSVRSIRVRWLLPVGHPTQPFLADYLSDCRQQLLLNQIITPCCSLAELLEQAKPLPCCQPAVFIGHLSRCGSTLLAGVLAEADNSLVLSEPPLLTDVLLETQLAPALQQQVLTACINLQAAAFAGRPAVVIKWNAWDLLHWAKIRWGYPAVPTLFLIRAPLEILASQQKSAGRHMSGDPTLGTLHPVFAGSTPFTSPLVHQVAVLRVLLETLPQLLAQQNAMLLDYQQLQEANLLTLAERLGFAMTNTVCARVRQRLQFDAKVPGRRFAADSAAKRQQFSASEQVFIQQQLAELYQLLCQQQAEFANRQELQDAD